MRYAIFSDVHSNLQALETFFSLIEQESDLVPICLGDIAGYGAHPNECIEMIREREMPVVIGNHEFAIIDPGSASTFNDYARVAIVWQNKIINPKHKAYFYAIPWTLNFGKEFAITHGDFSRPEEFVYVNSPQTAMSSFNGLKLHVGFFGHTHIPEVFAFHRTVSDEPYVTCHSMRGNRQSLQLQSGVRYLINPGSLGQPRDHDPRGSYVIFDSDEMKITFHRFHYDFNRAAYAILQAGLPSVLAKRLMYGY